MRLNRNTAKILLATVGAFSFGLLDWIFNAMEHGMTFLTIPFYGFTRSTHWWWDLHSGTVMVCVFLYLCLDLFEKKEKVRV